MTGRWRHPSCCAWSGHRTSRRGLGLLRKTCPSSMPTAEAAVWPYLAIEDVATTRCRSKVYELVRALCGSTEARNDDGLIPCALAVRSNSRTRGRSCMRRRQEHRLVVVVVHAGRRPGIADDSGRRSTQLRNSDCHEKGGDDCHEHAQQPVSGMRSNHVRQLFPGIWRVGRRKRLG